MVHPLRMLRWLYLGRLTLAAGIFGGAVFAWMQATQETTLLATLSLLLSLAVTFTSLWWTYGLGRKPGPNFLYAQVLFDALLVTAIVHMTNDGGSVFAPLYILVIAAGALLLPLPGGLLIGALVSVLYTADLVFLNPPPPGGPTVQVGFWDIPAPWGAVLLQIVVFGLMALVAGALGDRLRRTGHALGAVELELKQLRLDTDELLAAIDTALITVDDHGRLVYINDAGEVTLGLVAEDWRARNVVDELDHRAPGLGAVIRRTALTRIPVRRFEIRITEDTGDSWLGVRTTVLEREGAPWVTAVVQDITESKKIEDLMRRAERLQAVAELGASLAHEIRNPLASIRSAVEQLASEKLETRDRDTLRRLVLTESDRLTRLLSEFMEFSRVELRRWGDVDLVRIAADAIALAEQHPDSGRRPKIEFTHPRGPLVVQGDADLLHRAVFNLVLNAVQHAGERGRISVELTRLRTSELPPGVELLAPIRIAVADNGPGIPAEDAGKVFDPFFTTRHGGTGLGLAMVHRAVEAHQGTILVDDGPLQGARFSVYLSAQAERRSR